MSTELRRLLADQLRQHLWLSAAPWPNGADALWPERLADRLMPFFLDQLDAAAHRESALATDGERLAQAYWNVSRNRPALAAVLPAWDEISADLRANVVADGREIAAEYDRLSELLAVGAQESGSAE